MSDKPKATSTKKVAKTTEKDLSALEAHITDVIPTAEDFKAVGLVIEPDDVPDIGVWMAELKEVKEEDPKDLKPARVQVAVQRVVVGVASRLRTRHPKDADRITRMATAAIPRFTDKIVGT